MSLVYKQGRNLSTGTPKGVNTRVRKSNGDANTIVVTIEGPYSALEDLVPVQGATNSDLSYIPAGCYVQNATLTGDQTGLGEITITCINPGASEGSEDTGDVTEITYRVEMVEEQTDLIAHPTIAASETTVSICLKWLATDDKNKINQQGNGYQYDEGDGETFTPISDSNAIKFCQAWMHGIKTYNRYYPVIEKISICKRVPGLTADGAQITGGTADFSADIGKWNEPDINLQGYASTGYFKSKDSWQSLANRSWQRTEQWVWTPDGEGSQYGWIYQASSGAAKSNS